MEAGTLSEVKNMLMGTGCNGTSNERKVDTVGRSDALDMRREDREVCDRC